MYADPGSVCTVVEVSAARSFFVPWAPLVGIIKFTVKIRAIAVHIFFEFFGVCFMYFMVHGTGHLAYATDRPPKRAGFYLLLPAEIMKLSV